MNLKTGMIIEVHWVDAWSNSHGRYEEEFDYGKLDMLDIGYFVEEREDGILMCRTNQSDGRAWVGETFIPWEMIVTITVLV